MDKVSAVCRKEFMTAIVLLSGGVDSATCLALAVERYGKENVIALSSEYGQKHNKESEYAQKIADYYGVKRLLIDLSSTMQYSDCSLLKHSNKEIIKKSYSEQTDGKNPVSTYVPFRNGLFLSVAAAIGLSIGASEIWYGAHADDAAGAAYPDCSELFVKKINSAIMEGTAGQIEVVAPYCKTNKAGVVKDGLRMKVPYEYTWSCYEGGEKPCGKCGTCIDRAKAFKENNIDDPLLKK